MIMDRQFRRLCVVVFVFGLSLAPLFDTLLP